MAAKLELRIGIETDLGRLAHTHVLKIGFLEVRLDPRPVARNDADRRQAGNHHLPHLEPVRLAYCSRNRGVNLCPRQVEQGLLPLDLPGGNRRVLSRGC